MVFRASAKRPRNRVPPAILALVALLATACATSPPDPVEPPPPAPEVAVESWESPGLPEIYARHISQMVEEDIALGKIVVRVGESIGGEETGGRMLLEEEAFSRLVDDVSALRSSRVGVIAFWDKVTEQWTRIATHEDRAALEILDSLPDD